MPRTEFGGTCEALVDLSNVTGRDRHAALARRFLDQSLLGPLREHRDVLDRMHANTQIAKVFGYQRLGEVADAASAVTATESPRPGRPSRG
ncbi:beta-L-arabinofuranosidase domain-containing protein [Streptomyces sp. NPDC002888]|uniref:beta-L-arabinofuranosidase domain-containing protein n=1 Tax=Streptomyces sp. NPDC002888 TaxID=3364668 RepID=UPI003695F4C9